MNVERIADKIAESFLADIQGASVKALLTRASEVTPEPIHWLWEGWLAAGKFHIIGGAPGCGKTSIALALASVISLGGLWPDGTKSKPGNVVIWSGEDDPKDVLVPRLIASGADLGRVYFVSGITVCAQKRSFDPATDMDALNLKLREIDDVRLLIIDPIVSAVAADSHKNAETRRGLQPLVNLATALDCAVLGITHFSKGTAGRDPLERVTGSIAFGALARIVMLAAKSQGDEASTDSRIFCRAKSNIGPDNGGFQYALQQKNLLDHPEIEASFVHWGESLDGSARDLLAAAETTEGTSELADAKRFLRDLLSNGPISARQVRSDAEAVGFAWATLRRAQNELGVEVRRQGAPGIKGGGVWLWALSGLRCSSAQNPTQTHEVEHLNRGLAQSGFERDFEESDGLRCSPHNGEHLNQDGRLNRPGRSVQ